LVGWIALGAGAAIAQQPAEVPASVEADDDEERERADPDDVDDTVIVYEPDGTPRVAGSAHVVDEETLERFEYDDIGRVLSTTPGVYIRGEDGFGLRPNIGLRGANSDRSSKITLLEDGLPMAPGPYAANAAYYFPMATRLVGVEVFKGPASIAHGPQTVGGAINVRTRAVPREPTAFVDAAYGMRNTAKVHGFVGTGNERVGVLAEVTHLQTDGFKTLDPVGDGTVPGALQPPDDTGFERSDVMFKAAWNTDPALASRHALTLKLGWGSEVSNETYLGLHIDDYDADPYRRYRASALDRMEWNRTQAELTWQADPKPGLRIRTSVYHRYLTRKWFKLNTFRDGPDLHAVLQGDAVGESADFLAVLRGEQDTKTPGQALMIGANDRDFHVFGAQSRVRWRVRSGRFDSQLEAGVRVHGDIVDRLHTQAAHQQLAGRLVRDDTPLETTLDSRASATALALYAQDDLQITMGRSKLHLLPGLRSETVRTGYRSASRGEEDPQIRTYLLPGMGVLFEPNDLVQVLAGVYRGFSPVAPGQAPEIGPETSVNSELGARIGDGYTRVEVVGFLNDYGNLTGQCTISGGCIGEQLDQQFNGGKAWVYGTEAIAQHEAFLPGRIRMPISVSATWTETRFRTGFVSGFPQFGVVEIGDRLPYVPQLQGGARVALDHARFGIGAGVTARSGMRDAASSGPLEATDIPPQVLVDANARVRPNDVFELYTTVINATNTRVLESWRPFGARPTAPFQVMVGIKLTP
jgi:Fe(3+) dicitrate transport protein